MNRIGNSLFCLGENERIVEALICWKAEFLVVGGLAVAWHCLERTADDMDLLVRPTLENSRRIASALSSIGLRDIDDQSFARTSVQLQLKTIYYADILTPLPDGETFDEMRLEAVPAQLFQHRVLVASISSMLRMKSLAMQSDPGAGKHSVDIELLLRAQARQLHVGSPPQ
jgi:hypothetical protein